MGWANSAYYGSNVPAKSISDAIMRVLGFDLVFNMALGMSIGASLALPKSHVSGASPYWLDSVYRAATMEALARQFPKQEAPDPGTCYLIGLLSNFGTLVMGHVFPPQYTTICQIQEANPKLPHHFIDQHVMGLNREVIASTLLEQWDVADEITNAIRFQYTPNYVGDHQLYTHLIALTIELLQQQMEPDGSQPIDPHLTEWAVTLGICEHGLQEVVEVIHTSQQELSSLAKALEK